MSTQLLPLGEIATIFVGMPTKASEIDDAGPWGNVLTVRNLTGSGLDLETIDEVGVAGRDVERYRVQSGDLLLSARSTSLRSAVVPPLKADLLINATLIGVRSTTILPRLLAAWFESPEGRLELESVSQSGTSQMNITVTGLGKIAVPVPDLAIQRQMVQLLETADDAYRSAVQAAEDRRRIARQVVVNNMKKDN